MHIVVTAGNTLSMIDRVRGITNVFTGRTGASIARAAHEAGHEVTLVTSRPEPAPFGVVPFDTFEELERMMEIVCRDPTFDVLIHCAAVSDYRTAGAYRDPAGPPLDPAGKIPSDHPELWLKLERAPKLIDQVREPWGFRVRWSSSNSRSAAPMPSCWPSPRGRGCNREPI